MNDLYQDLIMDHGRRPRHKGRLSEVTHSMDGDNPLCGDLLTVFLQVKEGLIEKASFEGHGCAVFTAATSMMLEFAVGKTVAEFDAVYQAYHKLLTGDALSECEQECLGKLKAFSGVAQYPMRVKCATLCWHTMGAALNGSSDIVTTE